MSPLRHFLTAVSFVCSLFSLAAAEVSPQRLEQQARAYAESGQFTGSVLVARNGQILLSKGYGLANAEWGIPNSPETKFRLGSITKQFTAFAVLLLEQQGKLKVSDPVCRFVEPCPAAWQPLTLHHLLSHTGGVPNFTSFPDYTKTMALPSPPAETLNRFKDKPLEFTPGSKFKYSNSGYVLLGYIIEKASGLGYADFLKQHVFAPMGLKDTGYDLAGDVLARRAAGYQFSGNTLRNAAYMDMTIPHGAGSLYSTTLDLMKWDSALRAGQLLTPENYKRYYTPVQGTYAYGWDIERVAGVEVIQHNGGINGFATVIYRAPEKGIVVVALSNVLPTKCGPLGKELLRLALGEEVAVPEVPKVQVPVATLRQYVGEYELGPNFILTITLEGETLITQATGQGKIAIFPKSETVFYPREMEAEITFLKDESGRVNALELFQGGRRMKANRR